MNKKVPVGLLLGVVIALPAPTLLGLQHQRQGRIVFSACQEAGTMTVHTDSDPPGADVRVDGSLVGQTPAKLCLQAGKHTIIVSRPGYIEEAREMETLPGSEVLLEAELEKGPSEAEREEFYRRSIATVWALRGIEDAKSCRQALERYRRDFGNLPPTIRNLIELTYRDLMGACDTNHPLRADREKARRYLSGITIKW
jgi:hypothetical protein